MNPSKFKICHVSSAHDRTDDRIFLKECISLSKAGYDVSFVVQSEKSEDDQGVHIVVLKKRSGRWRRILLGPPSAFFTSLKTGAKIFHLHDPELLPLAPFYRLCGKRVIFDSHEDVPRQIFSKSWLGPRFLRSIISAVYSFLEWFCILFCARVISVTPEITNRFPQSKRALVRNFPIFDLVKQKQLSPNSTPVLIYAGGLSRIRGIVEILQALKKLDGKAKLWLLGPWSGEDYRSQCMQEPGWEYAEYKGMVRPEDVFEYYAKCDIGMALLYPEENYLRSLPIKTFEYMAAGLPVIMSDFEYWKENFREGAIFVDPFKADEIAEAIQKLIDDRKKMVELGIEGQKSAHLHFSWDSESRTLIELYNKLAGGR